MKPLTSRLKSTDGSVSSCEDHSNGSKRKKEGGGEQVVYFYIAYHGYPKQVLFLLPCLRAKRTTTARPASAVPKWNDGRGGARACKYASSFKGVLRKTLTKTSHWDQNVHICLGISRPCVRPGGSILLPHAICGDGEHVRSSIRDSEAPVNRRQLRRMCVCV